MHLGGDAWVEVIVLAGQRREVRAAAEDLRGVRGILQGDSVGAPPSSEAPPAITLRTLRERELEGAGGTLPWAREPWGGIRPDPALSGSKGQ